MSNLVLLSEKSRKGSGHETMLPAEMAALIGNFEVMKLLIEERDYDTKQKGTNGTTLLHYACGGGHLDIVKYLISEHQLDPLSEDDRNRIPLHYACEHGHLDTVRYLHGG